MAPVEIWAARQGAMDLLRPLLDAGLVEKIGAKNRPLCFKKPVHESEESGSGQIPDSQEGVIEEKKRAVNS